MSVIENNLLKTTETEIQNRKLDLLINLEIIK
jgi:hypothetical protein